MRYLMYVAMDPEGDTDPTGEGTIEIDDWVAKHDAAGTRVLGDRSLPPG